MLSAIQGFCLDEAANAPVLLDLISLPAGPARLCHSPEATNAHPTAVPDLPPRDKAQSPSGEEEEGGCFLHAAQPCWWPAEPVPVQEQWPLSCSGVGTHVHLPAGGGLLALPHRRAG